MKPIRIPVAAAVLLLFSGLSPAGTHAYADCGSDHGKKGHHGMGRISATTFEQMDADQNGAVSFEEFKAVFPRTTPEGFARLDNDGNGGLNPGEWRAFRDAHQGMGKYHTTPETT